MTESRCVQLTNRGERKSSSRQASSAPMTRWVSRSSNDVSSHARSAAEPLLSTAMHDRSPAGSPAATTSMSMSIATPQVAGPMTTVSSVASGPHSGAIACASVWRHARSSVRSTPLSALIRGVGRPSRTSDVVPQSIEPRPSSCGARGSPPTVPGEPTTSDRVALARSKTSSAVLCGSGSGSKISMSASSIAGRTRKSMEIGGSITGSGWGANVIWLAASVLAAMSSTATAVSEPRRSVISIDGGAVATAPLRAASTSPNDGSAAAAAGCVTSAVSCTSSREKKPPTPPRLILRASRMRTSSPSSSTSRSMADSAVSASTTTVP